MFRRAQWPRARATLSLKSIVRGPARYHTLRGHYLITPDVCPMLTLPESPEFDHPASSFYFKVADLQKVAATLPSRGVPFDQPPHLIAPTPDHDLSLAFFRDIDGNRQALMTEIPRCECAL